MAAEQSLGMRMKRLKGEARREAIAQVVSDYQASELTASEFCKSRGIATVTLSRWQRELRRGSRGKASSPRIVELRAKEAVWRGHFELSLPSGVSLRVPHGFDESELGRLLATLDASC